MPATKINCVITPADHTTKPLRTKTVLRVASGTNALAAARTAPIPTSSQDEVAGDSETLPIELIVTNKRGGQRTWV